ncbi:ESF1 homolog [Arctopsyche grandis]|uniref:ESF1 homolog n=1 Tax=Arctopsyche grandis TaxID=121162 RepID=UPI00406D7849
MENILKDTRFTKLVNDPRYRQIPKTERKVKIDKRFQSMFDNEKFKVKYTVDKRGKPVNQTSSENLKKYYDLSSDESASDSDDSEDNSEKLDIQNDENETTGKFIRPPKEDLDDEGSASDVGEIKNDKLDRGDLSKDVRKKLRDLDTDYARGEGLLLTDSSSDEDASEIDEEDELEHAWGELDANAETCEDATNRLAVCNMDWDNIAAADLFVLFNSFLPPGGLIRSVTIYPSEFGLKRMEEEEIRGPIELTKSKIKTDDESESDKDENEEGSKYHMEKLRQYQLNRLKYYYAVVIFDSALTANKVYSDCDGTEYESSATKLDLRFIPDDVTFDQEIHQECTEAPEVSRYKPRLFTTTALQQAKVELTWDAANPHRVEFLKDAADGEINDEDLKNYLACSSEEDNALASEEEEYEKVEENVDNTKSDPISKYKALLQEIGETEKKKKNRDVEMEITWGLGLKEKTQELVKKKLNKGDKMTPFEEMVEKQKEKKKAKKLERKKKNLELEKKDDSDAYSSDIPSDIDMNDPYFAEEFDTEEFKRKKNKKKSIKNKDIIERDEGEEQKRAELELLLDDDDSKAHFSLKKIQEAENETKTKKRRQKHKAKETNQNTVIPEFEVNVNDDRFSALFTSHHYNIDPTDPNFKKTKAMDTLIQEKLKRRPVESAVEDEIAHKKPKKDPAMTVLVNSLKRKSKNINNK